MLEVIKKKISDKRGSEHFFWRSLFGVKDSLFPGWDEIKKRGVENNLKVPLGDILEVMQREILNSSYCGIPAQKSPVDFWVYMNIIYETRPDVIIEIGNYCGGSTLALAHFLDNIGNGKVIGVDIDHSKVPDKVREHGRIELITGDACEVLDRVKGLIDGSGPVMVIEDSSHSYDNTLDILRAYSPLVTRGSYFIVEDSLISHGLSRGGISGPYEAIVSFIEEDSAFEIDRTKENFVITWNPKGYLRRI